MSHDSHLGDSVPSEEEGDWREHRRYKQADDKEQPVDVDADFDERD